MKKITIATVRSMYREPLEIIGYQFGEGRKTLCIVGSMRGNEYSQIFACSQLIHRMKQLEEEGSLHLGHEILIIPTLNNYSMNVYKRFWTTDNTDINRMFPGYDKGETTQQIAAAAFEVINQYQYGIQFASYYMDVDFIPHIRMMKTGYEDFELANEFGLPFAVLRKPRPYDTTTLNYNLQVFDTMAFSLFTSTNDSITNADILMARDAVLRFMRARDLIDIRLPAGYQTRKINYEDIFSIRCEHGGIFKAIKMAGEQVNKGDLLAEIYDPMDGEIIEYIRTDYDGIVFFAHGKLAISGQSTVYKII